MAKSKDRAKLGVETEEWPLIERLSKEFKRVLPSSPAIIDETFNRLVERHTLDEHSIKEGFSSIIVALVHDATLTYMEYERTALAHALTNVYATFSVGGTADGVIQAMHNYPKALDEFFLSIQQGRKARAGSTFEAFVAKLLTLMNYPYTAQPKIDGNPDFVFPSYDRYMHAAMDCMVFTIKTTLRERWRQITTEGAKGGNLFLATLDPKVKRNDIEEMSKQRVYLVVPRDLKEQVYEPFINVISFEEFFSSHLDPAVVRWAKN